MDEEKQPGELPIVLGHAIVGAVVALVVAKIVKARTPKIVVGAVVAIAAHAYFDAPVSQALSDAGL